MEIIDEDGWLTGHCYTTTPLIGGPYDGIKIDFNFRPPDEILLGEAYYWLDKSGRGPDPEGGRTLCSTSDCYRYGANG